LFLRYLLRHAVRTAFELGFDSKRPVPPFWVRIAAIAQLIGSGAGLADALAPTFIGLFINLIADGAYTIMSGVVSVAAAFGLYRLNHNARRVAIGYFAVSTLHAALWTTLGPAPQGRFTPVCVGLLVAVVTIPSAEGCYLLTRRPLFSKTLLEAV
jgi:hypothetical protein